MNVSGFRVASAGLRLAHGLRRVSVLSETNVSRFASTWAGVKMGPPDPILGVTQAFLACKAPLKQNLGVGAYRDDTGKPYVLPSVREAERRILAESPNHEYATIVGIKEFVDEAMKLTYGDSSPLLKENKVSGAQVLSGTGGLRVMGEFFKFHYPGEKAIYLPNPTWGNHIPIFKNSGLDVRTYNYYDPSTLGLNFEGMAKDLKAAPSGSIILFHACAHNPTGVDPTQAQWDELSKLCKEKNHFIFFDSAYQGFASGDFARDAYAIRKFVADGHKPAVIQSFAKNMGLYGERAGVLSVVCDSEEERARVDSQVKIVIRPNYSSPPLYGARLASKILADPVLRKQWEAEVTGMADRIILMRKMLRDNLYALGSKRDWSHITNQIGMFCFSGLTPEQVDRLTNEFHIYLTRNGRISMAGVTSKGVEYLAKSIHEVTK